MTSVIAADDLYQNMTTGIFENAPLSPFHPKQESGHSVEVLWEYLKVYEIPEGLVAGFDLVECQVSEFFQAESLYTK